MELKYHIVRQYHACGHANCMQLGAFESWDSSMDSYCIIELISPDLVCGLMYNFS